MTTRTLKQLFADISRSTPLTPDSAFGGKQARKDKAVALTEAHMAADAYISGLYWDYDAPENAPKGCLVGCLAHDHNSPHQKLETLYGIPAPLAILADDLFEALSDVGNEGADDLPLQFIQAIPVGADLRLVAVKFYLWVLQNFDGSRSHNFTRGDRTDFTKLLEYHLSTGQIQPDAIRIMDDFTYPAYKMGEQYFYPEDPDRFLHNFSDADVKACRSKLLKLIREAA